MAACDARAASRPRRRARLVSWHAVAGQSGVPGPLQSSPEPHLPAQRPGPGGAPSVLAHSAHPLPGPGRRGGGRTAVPGNDGLPAATPDRGARVSGPTTNDQRPTTNDGAGGGGQWSVVGGRSSPQQCAAAIEPVRGSRGGAAGDRNGTDDGT